MSQIVSSLPNKFDQGIFAALCFDFSLSKNFVSYFICLAAFIHSQSFSPNLDSSLLFPVAIGSAKVNTFFNRATIC